MDKQKKNLSADEMRTVTSTKSAIKYKDILTVRSHQNYLESEIFSQGVQTAHIDYQR